MKLFSFLFSIYVLGLILVPCADVHSENITEISILEESHSNEADACTPFCFCECCQTLSQPESYNTYQVELNNFALIVPSLNQNEKDNCFSFWRPPKV